jgi:acetyl-CoA C-acetyltransferase
MRPVYAISGGVSKFAKSRPDKFFAALVKKASDYAINDIGLDFQTFTKLVDGSVASYFSDHFTRQLMAAIMVQDYLGLVPKPSHRVEVVAPPGAYVSRSPGNLSPADIWITVPPMALKP